MSSDFLVKQDGALLRVTINKPDNGNRVSDAMAGELGGLIEKAHETSRVILLSAAGQDFCLGRAMMGPGGGPPPEALALRRQNEVIFNAYGAFRKSPCPVVAAVQGKALGFGCALSAVADVTIAADTAEFQFPEMNHPIMPTMAMSAMIDRVAYKPLLHMFYSCDTLSAQEALMIGLVSKVVPAAKLAESADAFCQKLLGMAPAIVLAAKEYPRAARTMDLQGQADFARNLHAAINSSSELRKQH